MSYEVTGPTDENLCIWPRETGAGAWPGAPVGGLVVIAFSVCPLTLPIPAGCHLSQHLPLSLSHREEHPDSCFLAPASKYSTLIMTLCCRKWLSIQFPES